MQYFIALNQDRKKWGTEEISLMASIPVLTAETHLLTRNNIKQCMDK